MTRDKDHCMAKTSQENISKNQAGSPKDTLVLSAVGLWAGFLETIDRMPTVYLDLEKLPIWGKDWRGERLKA